MAHQIFISHTQLDKAFCDSFDVVCARAGMKAFRSEFEKIEPPAWMTIKDALEKSIVMFLLVGKELRAIVSYPSPNWEYTKNWIAYEVGVACEHGIDVWVVCDDGVEINFPVPYFNNYLPAGFHSKEGVDFMRQILEAYNAGQSFPIDGSIAVTCPYDNCRIEFNLRVRLDPGGEVTCPQCLRRIRFNQGFGI